MASIQTLSQNIAKNTALIEQWLATKNAKPLSFEQDADEEFPSAAGEPEIEAARLAILDDTRTLHDLVLGPGEVLRRICWGVSTIKKRFVALAKTHDSSPLTTLCNNASTISSSFRPSHFRAVPPTKRSLRRPVCPSRRSRLLCASLQPTACSAKTTPTMSCTPLPPHYSYVTGS